MSAHRIFKGLIIYLFAIPACTLRSTVISRSSSSGLVAINIPRPPNILAYTPPSSGISSTDLQNWISLQCSNGITQFGVTPGAYSIDDTLTYPPNCKGTTLWTDQVTLTFTNLSSEMVILETPDVTIRGGIYQYQTPTFSQAKVTGINGNTFNFTVSDGYPLQEFQSSTFNFNIMNPITRGPKTEVYYDYYNVSLAPVSGSTNSFVASGLDTSQLVIGDSIVTRAPFNYCFYIYGGNDTLADITLYNCIGFGIFDLGPGGDTFRNFNIRFPPNNYPGTTEPPLVTSAADMIYVYARKGPTIDQCHLEGSLDDGIAIHGSSARPSAVTGNQLTIEGFTSQFSFDGSIGENMRLYDDLSGFICSNEY